jgi:hypothetical protein
VVLGIYVISVLWQGRKELQCGFGNLCYIGGKVILRAWQVGLLWLDLRRVLKSTKTIYRVGQPLKLIVELFISP